jgi:hypothetical protein
MVDAVLRLGQWEDDWTRPRAFLFEVRASARCLSPPFAHDPCLPQISIPFQLPTRYSDEHRGACGK